MKRFLPLTISILVCSMWLGDGCAQEGEKTDVKSTFESFVSAVQKKDIQRVFAMDYKQVKRCKDVFKSDKEKYFKEFSKLFEVKANDGCSCYFCDLAPFCEIDTGPAGYTPKIFFPAGVKVKVLDVIVKKSEYEEGRRYAKLQVKVNYDSSNSPYYVKEVEVDFPEQTTSFGIPMIKPTPLYPSTIFEHNHPFRKAPKFRKYDLIISPQGIKQAIIIVEMELNPGLSNRWLFKNLNWSEEKF